MSAVGRTPLFAVLHRDHRLEQLQRRAFTAAARPTWVSPYIQLMRADKPIGSLLLMWPGAPSLAPQASDTVISQRRCACVGWWSIAMAAPVGELPQVGLLCTFGVGAFVMRGAGCTINDLWDREIDAKVERTKTRPLASGVSRLYAHRSKSATLQSSRFVQALSVAQAVGFLGVQLSVGLAVLLSLNKSVSLAQSRSRVSRFCYQQLEPQRPQCSCAAQQAHVRLQCSFSIRSYSIWLGVAAMPLVICYPLAKVRNHLLN